MNSIIKFFLLCPVPDNQKPINELILFEDDPFFNWITLKNEKFENKFYTKYFFLFLLSFMFFLEKIKINSFIYVIVSSLLISSFLFFIYFFITFIRWFEIYSKFNQARFVYEEESWFDTKIWEKPISLIKNDRLLITQKINVIIERISKKILLLFYFNCFLIFCLKIEN
jgi:hypothetical protein